MRLIPTLKALVIVSFALRFRHHFHGPPVDYAGLAAAAAASWIGVPGPGEPVLIAAGVFAAKHKLDIVTVVAVAWASAAAAGTAGWLIGMKLGRVVMTGRGPLQRMRRTALERGDEIFGRFPVLAILLTPTWIAGIHRVRTRTFLPTNAAGALLWAAGIGLGAYFIGPAVIDFVDDFGWITGAALVIAVLAGITIEFRRRRRRADRSQSEQPAA